MSDPRDPDPAHAGRPGHEGEHHGLVEEIREEIAEAVEHVPKPVRWTVSRVAKLVALGFASLVLLAIVTAVLYVANRTEWVAQELALFANQALARHSDLVLEIRDIRGNPFTGVRFVGPRVRFRDGSGPPLVEAEALRVSYGAWGLLTGGRGPVHVDLDRPRFAVVTDADGRWRLPRWRSDGAKKPSRRGYDLEVAIHDGVIVVPAPLGGVSGWNARAAIATGGGTRVRLREMRWSQGPWGSELRQLAGEFSTGDSVRVSLDRLVTGDVALRGRAAWKSGESRRVVDVDVERVRWAWLARVFQNGAFDVPGEGAVRASASGDRQWKGAFEGTFDWDGLAGDARGRFDYDGVKWRVSELAGHSPAGDLDGRFDYAKDGWVLAADVVRGDPSQWGAIHLKGWPKGDLAGRFRYTVNAAKDGALEAWLGGSELAGWRADSARISARFLATADDTFEVRMRRRGGDVALFGSARAGGWRGRWTVAGLPLDEWPDGRASGIRGVATEGAGGVDGRPDGLWVTGELAGESSQWLGVGMARWRVRELAGRLLPTPDLALEARLRDAMYLGVHFDSSALAIGVGDRTARLGDVRAWAGDTLVSLAGDAAWTTSGWTTTFERARATSSQFDWRAEPPIALHGDSKAVVFDRLIARDGDARLAIGGRWPSPGGGAYDWTLDATHLDLGRLGLPVEWRLGGTADARLRVTGAAGDARFAFDATASRPSERGHRADTLRLGLTGAPHRLLVREAHFGVAGGALDGALEFADTREAWPDTLAPEGVLRWLSSAGRWDGRFEAKRLALEGLPALAPDAQGWSGLADGTLGIAGSPGRPRLDLEGRAEPIAFRGYGADRASVRARYDGARLVVDDFRLVRGAVESKAEGEMSVALALGEKPRLPEEPMRWTLKLPNGDLGIVTSFVPQLGYAAGRFDVDAVVTGTPRHPSMKGTARVRQGVVRMTARDEIVEDVYADLRFDETRITLDTLSARQHPTGRLTGRGAVTLDALALEGYRFDVALRNFTTSDPGLYAAVFDGDFVVTNGHRLHGQTLPHVEGRADVSEARVFIDFANQSEEEQLAATTVPLFWTYRIDVNATKNIRWQPPDADIEFSAGLTMEQTTDSLLIYGEMHALRGNYFFLSNQFKVEQADLTFDNLKGVDPTVDARASTRIVPVGSGDNAVVHTVTVEITGRAREPEVSFSSDPADWDDSEVLRQLAGIDRLRTLSQGNVAQSVGDPLDSYLTQALNRTLSAELSRTFNGYLNDWAIERERGGLATGSGGVIVGFSTQPWRNVNVRYRQRVPGGGRDYAGVGTISNPFERSVEAEYRLSRFFYVTSEFTQRRDVAGTTSSGAPEFNVNLKARWEY